MAKVALVACDRYDQEMVDKAVARGLELLGGPEQFARSEETILLKPNVLFGDPPEKCTNTHPVVLKAVIKAFRPTGARITYGDSPGFGPTHAALKRAKLAEAAEEMKIEEADFKTGREVPAGGAGIDSILDSVPIAQGVLDSDGVVSLPKLKTHGFQKYTGCVKNQYGCIPGLTKAAFHVRFPDANDFAKMLLTVNRIVNPRLYIMDGIWGMEGNGPRGGTPVNMGLLLFSTDPIALDATVCRMINLEPQNVPTIKFGVIQGDGTDKEEEIELAGEPIERFKKTDFIIDRAPLRPYRDGGPFRLSANVLVPKPTIDPEKCIRCGVCVQACPADPKALSWPEGKPGENPPVYDYSNCIRCYCCQEMCPESAVYLRKTIIRKLFDALSGGGQKNGRKQ